MKIREDRRLLLLTLGVFAAAILLLYLFRDALYDAVLNPILYLGWVAWLALRAVDQWVLWVLLCLAVLYIGLRGLLKRQIRPPDKGFDPGGQLRTRGRVSYWARQISGTERNDFFSEDARSAIRRLARRVLAPGFSPGDDEPGRAAGMEGLQAPPEILAYLQRQGPAQPESGRFPWFSEIKGRLLEWLNPQETPQVVDPQILRTLEFLEEEMEGTERDETR